MLCSLGWDFLISNLWNSRVISGCLNFDMRANKQRSILYECGLDKMRPRQRHLIWITTMLSTHTGNNQIWGPTHTVCLSPPPKKRPGLTPKNSVSQECSFKNCHMFHPSIQPSIHLPDAQLKRVKFMGIRIEELGMGRKMKWGLEMGLLIDSRHSVAGTWTS